MSADSNLSSNTNAVLERLRQTKERQQAQHATPRERPCACDLCISIDEIERLQREHDLTYENGKADGFLEREELRAEIERLKQHKISGQIAECGCLLAAGGWPYHSNRTCLSIGRRAVETPAPLDEKFFAALDICGTQEPLEVYDSNSWRRIGLARRYEEVIIPERQRVDGHLNISNTNLLRALVAAFNAMLARRAEKTTTMQVRNGPLEKFPCDICGKGISDHLGAGLICPTNEKFPGVVQGTDLEEQIRLARASVATWPPELREALGIFQKTPVHVDPTGATREPPHCPSCSCGMADRHHGGTTVEEREGSTQPPMCRCATYCFLASGGKFDPEPKCRQLPVREKSRFDFK